MLADRYLTGEEMGKAEWTALSVLIEKGIRRITTTPLYFKAENWRLDMPGISVYPASIYSTPWISG
jgi:hypothetical protein